MAVEPGSVDDSLGPGFLWQEAPGGTDTPHGLGVSLGGTSKGKALNLLDRVSQTCHYKRDRKIADKRIRG